MKNVISILMTIALALPFCSCSKKGSAVEGADLKPVVVSIGGGNNMTMTPKATVIKINPEFDNKVAVTLNAAGSLLYFPAPSDITPASAPYPLADGWYLDRQGIGQNSVFTDWTFEQYASLPKVPSQEEILNHIIPGSGIQAIEKLPISASQAVADPAACIPYLPK